MYEYLIGLSIEEAVEELEAREVEFGFDGFDTFEEASEAGDAEYAFYIGQFWGECYSVEVEDGVIVEVYDDSCEE